MNIDLNWLFMILPTKNILLLFRWCLNILIQTNNEWATDLTEKLDGEDDLDIKLIPDSRLIRMWYA